MGPFGHVYGAVGEGVGRVSRGGGGGRMGVAGDGEEGVGEGKGIGLVRFVKQGVLMNRSGRRKLK